MKELLAILLFIIFPCCGIQALLDGEIGMAMFFFLPLAFALCVLAYHELYEKPNEKRQEALRKMYNLPIGFSHEYGEVWDKEFQKVIKKAIESTSDTAKLSELRRCQNVAKEMIKDSGPNRLDRPYYKINNAFRLTGCHLAITDSEGKTIAQIV